MYGVDEIQTLHVTNVGRYKGRTVQKSDKRRTYKRRTSTNVGRVQL